jgi:hypothetical protein
MGATRCASLGVGNVGQGSCPDPGPKLAFSLQLPPPSYTDQLAANIGGAAANGGQLHGGQRAALEQHAALDQHLEAELQRQQQEHAILQRQLVHTLKP